MSRSVITALIIPDYNIIVIGEGITPTVNNEYVKVLYNPLDQC